MPTPDTETLAARLRAVERALTEEDASPDLPSAGHRAGDSGEVARTTSNEHRTDHTAAVEHRLCRLEAAVQALRAALDEGEADGAPPDEPVRAGSRRVVDGGDWPDDLEPE